MRLNPALLLFGSALFLINCSEQDCNELPSSFETYQKATELVKGAHFAIEENISTPGSSWIRSASYFSCNKTTGYFIIKTHKKEYIHDNLPVEVWKEFKNASSYGSYYSQHIKGRYQLTIN